MFKNSGSGLMWRTDVLYGHWTAVAPGARGRMKGVILPLATKLDNAGRESVPQPDSF
jgi:hypothetical protein